MDDASPDSAPEVKSGPLPVRARAPRSWRLLEVLVAMSILVTLAGLLVPYTERVGERTRLAGANGDLATIASSLSSFAGDLHHDALRAAPADGVDPSADGSAAWLRGPGELPDGCPPEIAELAAPLDRLTLPESIDRAQRGPLMLALQPDPWGHSYLIRLDELGQGTSRSRVLSAGPDGTLLTADDLAHPID